MNRGIRSPRCAQSRPSDRATIHSPPPSYPATQDAPRLATLSIPSLHSFRSRWFDGREARASGNDLAQHLPTNRSIRHRAERRRAPPAACAVRLTMVLGVAPYPLDGPRVVTVSSGESRCRLAPRALPRVNRPSFSVRRHRHESLCSRLPSTPSSSRSALRPVTQPAVVATKRFPPGHPASRPRHEAHCARLCCRAQ